ncbi:MAG: TonB-dependent receptor, partial [Bacteroidales bacterium]|nr:TonB-dependent receptor [Bacteroidales bacterium]
IYILLVIIGVTQAMGMNTYSQKTLINLHMDNTTVEDVINGIEEQSEFRFLYNKKIVNVESKVSIKASNENITSVLDNLFRDADISYAISDRQIVLNRKDVFLAALPAIAQQTGKRITGTVIDLNGEPIIGANIREKGISNGTVTDVEGNFSLTVKDDAILQVSYIGYIAQEISVLPLTGEGAPLIIKLLEDTKTLEEVVVIGYGTLPKRSVTTAISVLNAENIKEMPVGTLAESLYGQMSGLYLVQSDGQPGSAPSIRIRGTGSLTASSEPLFVIDGYPTNDAQVFANLSAENIESIQVLKDAASAAIYGSRAGNGVIMVTTKKGSKGGFPIINFNATAGFQQPQRYIDVLNSAEFAQMVKEAREYRNMPAVPFFDDPSQWVETDWQKEYFRTAPMQRYELSARGAAEKVNYSMSLNFSDQQGIVLNSYNKRIGARFQIDTDLSKYVTVGANFAPTWTQQRRQTTTGGNTSYTDGTIADALTYPPFFPAYAPDGDYFQIQQHTSGTDLNSELTNPLSKLLETNNDYTVYRTLSQAFINIRPIKGLVVKTEFNLSTINQKREFYRSAYAPGTSRKGNKSTPDMTAIAAERASSFDYGWHWSNTATYNHVFNNVHSLTAMIAYDVTYESEFQVRQLTRTDASYPIAFGNDLIKNVTGAYLYNGASTNTEYVSDAVLGRINYDYGSKYLLSGSIRQDRSSKFGPNKRAGIFWSTSAGWNITEESFAKDISWLTIAKLRASYGVNGNDRIGGNYVWTSSMSTANYAFGSGSAVNSVTGYYPGGYSNTYLSWEKNTQFDAGIELGLFKRLTIIVDWYDRLSDAVLAVTIPNLNGKATSVTMNAGEIRNRGVEIEVNSPIINKAFKWTAGFNISFNRNKLLSLATGNDYYGSVTGNVRNYVGRPLGDMYFYQTVGYFNTVDEVKTLPRLNGSAGDIGDLRFLDWNNTADEGVPDGTVNSWDMKYMGNNMPKFNYGFTSRMSYKNFDLSFVLDGQAGGLVYWQAYAYALNRHMENTIAYYSRDRWRGNRDTEEIYSQGDGKSAVAGGNTTIALAAADRYVFKSNYLKIRNIALGYTVPRSFTNKIGLKSLRVNVNAQNLWSFDEFPGYSIETGGMGGSTGGTAAGQYPVPRTITFGANISF